MRVAIQLDREHSLKLAAGRPVTIRVPKDATAITLHTSMPAQRSSFAEVVDVFFNGRPART